MATPIINPTTLDPDALRASLITFLKSQPEFTDYNFDGSGLAVLLNILTANTHYYALYKAMVANESFLDSAILRSSIISRANEKGYLPNGVKASSSTLTAVLTGATPGQTSMPVPKGTVFQGTVNNKLYYFVNPDQVDLLPTLTSGQYSGSIVVREGQYVTTTFDVVAGARYFLPNGNVDPSTIRVRVQTSRQNNASVTYFPVSSIINVTTLSAVYFLNEGADGLYELVFGNGTFGVALQAGNVIVVDYIVSTPGEGDGVTVITPATPIFNTGILTLTATASAGSALPETIDSIRENARRYTPQQNRCVTDVDYETEVRRVFPEYVDVIAWGGEKNVPPILGKTFICPLAGDLLPLTRKRKQDIIDACKTKNVTGINPEVVDPAMSYLRLAVTSKYDPKKTTLTPNEISTTILNIISAYNTTKLTKFACQFIESQLITQITDSDPSMISTRIVVQLESTIYPDLQNVGNYEIQFSTTIKPGTLSSEPFIIQDSIPNVIYRLADLDGIVQVVGHPNDGSAAFVVPGNWGRVDYTLGTVMLGGILIQPTINKSGWTVLATPVDQDIFTSGNHVISINMNSSQVNLQVVKQ